MKLAVDKLFLNIECPDCGKDCKETVGMLKCNPGITCGGCGATIELKAEELKKHIESLEKTDAIN